jgi:hypothetical protein
MPKLARLLLLWIVAIALPLQGVYAATLQHCASAAHQSAIEDVHSFAHSHGEAIERAVHGGGEAMHLHAVAHSHVDPSGSGHSAHGAGAKGSCSACAACCSAAAPPPTPVVLVFRKAEHAVPPFVTPAVVTFVTDGPERPPRITLA